MEVEMKNLTEELTPVKKQLLRLLIESHYFIEDRNELMAIIMRKTRGHINPKTVDDLITNVRGK